MRHRSPPSRTESRDATRWADPDHPVTKRLLVLPHEPLPRSCRTPRRPGLTHPLVRKDGVLQPASWDEALGARSPSKLLQIRQRVRTCSDLPLPVRRLARDPQAPDRPVLRLSSARAPARSATSARAQARQHSCTTSAPATATTCSTCCTASTSCCGARTRRSATCTSCRCSRTRRRAGPQVVLIDPIHHKSVGARRPVTRRGPPPAATSSWRSASRAALFEDRPRPIADAEDCCDRRARRRASRLVRHPGRSNEWAAATADCRRSGRARSSRRALPTARRRSSSAGACSAASAAAPSSAPSTPSGGAVGQPVPRGRRRVVLLPPPQGLPGVWSDGPRTPRVVREPLLAPRPAGGPGPADPLPLGHRRQPGQRCCPTRPRQSRSAIEADRVRRRRRLPADRHRQAAPHVVLPVPTLLEDSDVLGAYGHHWIAESRPVVPMPPGVRHEVHDLPRTGTAASGSIQLPAGLDRPAASATRSPTSPARARTSRSLRKHGAVRSPVAEPAAVSDRRPAC